MGKGAGCVPSRKRHPVAAPSAPAAAADPPAPADPKPDAPPAPPPTSEAPAFDSAVAAAKLRVFIVFYSMYGHVECLAKRLKVGVDGIEGVEGVLYRVPETVSDEVLEKMKAPPKDGSVPVISAAELVEADGVLFGFPTRFGCMAAQMKAFFDSTGQLWQAQKLAGKPAGFFFSTGTQGGGQETTAYSLFFRCS